MKIIETKKVRLALSDVCAAYLCIPSRTVSHTPIFAAWQTDHGKSPKFTDAGTVAESSSLAT
jgi:hypothetical protein